MGDLYQWGRNILLKVQSLFSSKLHKRIPLSAYIGKLGERIALRHIRNQGMQILLKNYACKYGEIDIVALDKEVIVFIEVKTRDIKSWTRPAEAVGPHKRKALSKTALRCLRELGYPKRSFRFDIVEVVHKDGKVIEVSHIKDAFDLSNPYVYGV